MSSIIVAPFSNSDIRDWPMWHYSRLIGLIVKRWDGQGKIRVIGTASQKLRGNEIVRRHDPSRVSNDCGRLPWPRVQDELRSAACVIGNNSGVAHMAGMYGAPTVCVFGGSHARLEWRPLGPSVELVSRSIGCSPCHLDHGMACPYDKACLRDIDPDDVADVVFAVMDRVRRAREAAPFKGSAATRMHATPLAQGV